MGILVVGKSGQLARALVQLSALRGVPLIAVGRPELDLEDAELVRPIVTAVRPSTIVNSAAYTAVDQAEAEPERAFAVNRDGAARLAAVAAELQVPYIHISTDYVFDGRKSSPYNEEDQPNPLGVYGRSKLEGEQAVREACPAAVVLRTSWVYSPWGRNFVKTMLGLAETREVVKVVDDQHGAPTAAGDLARAILDIAAQLDASGRRAGTYHLTAAGETTWHGFAAAIFAGLVSRSRRVPVLIPIATRNYSTSARRPANSCLDCAKVARDFGIALPHWRESLEACVDELASVATEKP
jgi:dTDP-4-dehydrorhamnose reductase